MSLERRLLRRMRVLWTGVFTPMQLFFFVLLSAPGAYFWCWVLHAPERVTATLWWPALVVSGAFLLMQVWVTVFLRLMMPKAVVPDDDSFWGRFLGVAGSTCAFIGLARQRPDLGSVAAFVLGTIALAPKVIATRDVSHLPYRAAHAAWLALVLAGYGWPALFLMLAVSIASPFVRRGVFWFISNRPLYDDTLAEARESLARSKGYECLKPLNSLREMEQWQDLLEARDLPDHEARRWFKAQEKAQIWLGLGRPKKALAAMRSEESGLGDIRDLVQWEVEAHLQLNDTAAAEAALRRPRRRHFMQIFRLRGDLEEYFAWGLLYRHRGDDLRALYFFEQPFAGPAVDRKQYLAAAETLLKLGLPLEAAKVLEQRLDWTRWVKPEEMELLADCYRKAEHTGKADRIRVALAARVAGA